MLQLVRNKFKCLNVVASDYFSIDSKRYCGVDDNLYFEAIFLILKKGKGII